MTDPFADDLAAARPEPLGDCHYCGIAFRPGDERMQSKCGTAFAHFTCWYDDGPFEAEMALKALAR